MCIRPFYIPICSPFPLVSSGTVPCPFSLAGDDQAVGHYYIHFNPKHIS